MIRALVVRTTSFSANRRDLQRAIHTLGNIDVGARKSIVREKVRVHVNAVLGYVSDVGRLGGEQTESRTLPSALSSASTLSFLRCSSANVRWVARPFTMGCVVGPEGTVGA